MHTETMPQKGSIISAMLLVAGCCIGGGMLALPVGSGASGFLPSIATMAMCWVMMTLTALMLIEVSLWMEEGAHVITMTSRILGKPARLVSWVLFLYISYASEVAYAAGGGAQLSHFASGFLGYAVSKEICAAVVAIVLTFALIFGAQIVGRVNSILFMGLIIAYFMLVGMGSSEVSTDLLAREEWSSAYKALPLLLTAFSFQTMVPSLTPLLKRHTGALRIAIIGGTSIAFAVYAIWQAIILGIVPADGPHGLVQANIQSVPATVFLHEHVSNWWIVPVAQYFGFFAIVTSYLAIGLGLFDFIADGLKIEKKGWGNICIGVLIVIPTVFCAVYFERAFMVAMDTTGGFGDTIQNGMIPVMMVWTGRYMMGFKSSFRVPGGKPLLAIVFAFFFIGLLLEVLMVTGIIPSCAECIENARALNMIDIINE